MLKCSHILCKVDNISQVVRDYEALGFTMQWGSAPNRANNALLWFEQGPFIEFFQIPKPLTYFIRPLGLFYGQVAGRRWSYWAKAASGWCDLALEPEEQDMEHTQGGAVDDGRDLTVIKEAIDLAGVATSRVIHGRRTRPDGQKVKYSLFATEPLGLPFVVSTYDPPQRPLRITHPNGARGVEWVKMEVAEHQMDLFHALSQNDKWLRVDTSSHIRHSKVIEVGLSGLCQTLDSKLLHGAVITSV
ncbi:VOC family protein [Paenibacillus sp. ACRRX]|uniref:VOC family protein n=1 Tax=Paenibacillus sp. ACRRX TaxID=2918206 RepID=UPI001EF5BFB5|nr:VOC family protein [Paenibacillus sp. ACRRX]MCG7409835.1 VOC family protein [Paenibacillus sp. ACRRX]